MDDGYSTIYVACHLTVTNIFLEFCFDKPIISKVKYEFKIVYIIKINFKCIRLLVSNKTHTCKRIGVIFQ